MCLRIRSMGFLQAHVLWDFTRAYTPYVTDCDCCDTFPTRGTVTRSPSVPPALDLTTGVSVSSTRLGDLSQHLAQIWHLAGTQDLSLSLRLIYLLSGNGSLLPHADFL